MRTKRLSARKNDVEAMGNLQDGEIYENGEEIEIAYEEHSLIEGFELVCLFSLVYLVAQVQVFFDDLLQSCGWPACKKPGFPLAAYRSVIETRAQFSFHERKECFEFIREIILARNDFTHNSGYVSPRYAHEIPSPRFVRDDRIVFTMQDVQQAIELCDQFAEFIASKCLPFSKAI